MDITLTAIEARILGCLIEKEKTTPEYYPLSLNALLNACNQKSNRDPVMNLEESEVEANIFTLKEKRVVWQVMTSGSRTPKYKYDFSEVFKFSNKEIAVITVLMLRGPQTIGEIKNHCSRLYNFDDLAAVETVLEQLINHDDGSYIVHLERKTGHKERRFAHLLSGELDADSDAIIENTAEDSTIAGLEQRLAKLENELQELKEKINLE